MRLRFYYFFYFRLSRLLIKMSKPINMLTRPIATSLIWLQDNALPATYSQLVIPPSKLILLLNQYPFTISKKLFAIINSKKIQRIFSYLLILLHLAIILKWLLDQWLYPVKPTPPTWKFVLMYYCAVLFATGVVVGAKYTIHNNETVLMLNSALHIEQEFMIQGGLAIKVGESE